MEIMKFKDGETTRIFVVLIFSLAKKNSDVEKTNLNV